MVSIVTSGSWLCSSVCSIKCQVHFSLFNGVGVWKRRASLWRRVLSFAARLPQRISASYGRSVRAVCVTGGFLKRSEGLTTSLARVGSARASCPWSARTLGLLRLCRDLFIHKYCSSVALYSTFSEVIVYWSADEMCSFASSMCLVVLWSAPESCKQFVVDPRVCRLRSFVCSSPFRETNVNTSDSCIFLWYCVRWSRCWTCSYFLAVRLMPMSFFF